MLEKNIAQRFLKDFRLLYPMLSIRKEEQVRNRIADLMLEIETPGKKNLKRIVCEIKAEGFPKYLRLAGKQLKTALENDKSLYPAVVAPYISEEGRKICREENIGFFDLSGNCLLEFNGTYIEVKGNPNRFPTERKIKTIFKGKSSRILRVLLLNPDRQWTLRDLAKEASLSVGQVFKVITRLEELDLVERRDQGGVRLAKPDELLNSWRNEYSYRENESFNYYSLNSVLQIEQAIADECRRRKIRYAFTLFSGSSRISPFVRYNQAMAYVDDPVEVAEKLGLKKVESGSNVTLLKPYDEGVYYGSQSKDQIQIVSNIQLYLDLYDYKGRGEEQAEFLRSQVIRF